MLNLLFELDKSINLDDKNLSDYGHTALMQVAQLGDIEKVQWLLDRGANLHEKDTNNDQVLAVAAFHGQIEVVKYLLTLDIDIHNKNRFGDSALTHARNRGRDDVAQVIQEKIDENDRKPGPK